MFRSLVRLAVFELRWWLFQGGPRRIFYEANGTAITPGNFLSTGGTVRQKPDFTAADGVMTAAEPQASFNPFFGTSAAAPHAAAIAALILDADPSLTPAEVRNILVSAAIDIEAAGFDRDSGNGIIDAFTAVEEAAQPVIAVASTATPAAAQPCTVRMLKSFGISSPHRRRRIVGVQSQSESKPTNQMRDPTNQNSLPAS